MFGTGCQWRVGGLVEQIDGAVVVHQDRREVAGAAVGNAAAVGGDDDLGRGGGQRTFDRACVQAQNLQRLGGLVEGSDGGGQCAPKHAHDGGGLQAVADNVTDRDGEAVVGQVDQVVPVTAYVQRSGSGQVAHRDILMPGQVGRVKHGLLQGDGDLAVVVPDQHPCARAGRTGGVDHPPGGGRDCVRTVPSLRADLPGMTNRQPF